MCGYLIRKISNRHRCNINTCHIESLQNTETNITTTNQCFIYYKGLISSAGDFGRLICPTDTFLAFITEVENLFRAAADHLSHPYNIRQKLVTNALSTINVNLPICQVAIQQVTELYILVRLHAAAKFASRNIADENNSIRKNRKAIKVLHL